jgi:hypothetical protein
MTSGVEKIAPMSNSRSVPATGASLSAAWLSAAEANRIVANNRNGVLLNRVVHQTCAALEDATDVVCITPPLGNATGW